MNYKKLIRDSAAGNIPEQAVLVMDNDCGYWEWMDEVNDEVYDEKRNELKQKYGVPLGYNDIVDVLIAAGVKTEWC